MSMVDAVDTNNANSLIPGATLHAVITVTGTPAPMGSGRCINKGGRCMFVKGGSDKQKAAVQDWTKAVADACYMWREHRGFPPPLSGPLGIGQIFYHPNPPGNADSVYVHKQGPAGDLDKVIRATWDGITAGQIWEDDSRVSAVGLTTQQWVTPVQPSPGAVLFIYKLAPAPLQRIKHG